MAPDQVAATTPSSADPIASQPASRLPQYLAQLDRFACLVLDDIGYVQHDRDEMEVLFTLLAERYERRSVAISTNLIFSEWERIFKDPMTTLAAIDRVVHHSVILDLMGLESYRAQAASTTQPATGPPPVEAAAARGVLLVNGMISQQDCLTANAGEPKPAYRVVESWLKDDDVRGFLQVNRYLDVLWYNKEAFDQLLGLMLLAAVVDSASRPGRELTEVAEDIRGHYAVVRALRQAQAGSDYRVENLLAAAQGDRPALTAT